MLERCENTALRVAALFLAVCACEVMTCGRNTCTFHHEPTFPCFWLISPDLIPSD